MICKQAMGQCHGTLNVDTWISTQVSHNNRARFTITYFCQLEKTHDWLLTPKQINTNSLLLNPLRVLSAFLDLGCELGDGIVANFVFHHCVAAPWFKPI